MLVRLVYHLILCNDKQRESFVHLQKCKERWRCGQGDIYFREREILHVTLHDHAVFTIPRQLETYTY